MAILGPQVNETLPWKPVVSNAIRYTECDAHVDTDMHREAGINTHTDKQTPIRYEDKQDHGGQWPVPP